MKSTPLPLLSAFLVVLSHGAASAGPEAITTAKKTPAPGPPPLFGDWVDPEPTPITDGSSNTKSGTSTKRVPPVVTSYGPFKIGENESPLPQDRAYLTYHYYSDVLDSDFHRQTLGLERTILGGEASLGLRLPFNQAHGDFEIDDPSLIYKQRLLSSGDLTLSGGLAVTVPVNEYEPVRGGGGEHIPLLQPYLGYVWQRGAFFIHGFSSVGTPLGDDSLPVMLFNDLGVGWRMETGGGTIRALVPTLEVHVNTPLTHREAGDPERRRDSVDLTGGVHFQIGERTWLGLGVATTVSDPRLFEVEGIFNLNVRF